VPIGEFFNNSIKYKMKNMKNIQLFLAMVLLFTNVTISREISDPSEKALSFYQMEKAVVDNVNSTPAQKLGKFVPLTGNLEQMRNFLLKLKSGSKQPIRIAHYGDSLIFGDVITEYLREKFQNEYGGKGVGYVATVSDAFRMRLTIRHSYSDDWKYVSFLTRNPEKLPFGIDGTLAIPVNGSWVRYESSPMRGNVPFSTVRVFYSNADANSTIQYKFDNNSPQTLKLESGSNVEQIILKSNNSRKVEIKFVSGKQPYFYGVSIENGEGAYVDNFALRGNTGMSLLDIPGEIMADFQNYLKYDLIILSFGANVSSPSKGIYVVYVNKMVQVIDQIKKAFPNTGILLISVADKTSKKGNEYFTNPEVPALLETQKTIVEKANVAFWNMWEAMGGANSMDEWVMANPPLALRDFAHFNNEGGNAISQLMFDAIIDASKKIK